MALMRWNPMFSELAATRDRLSRFLGRDDFWEHDGITSDVDWTPSVDIFENEHTITIKAELPGVEAKDVAVSVDNNILTLKGQRQAEKEVKKDSYHRMERSYGTFSRSFALPASVDNENVKAEFKNGLLTVSLPKRESAKARTINVNAA